MDIFEHAESGEQRSAHFNGGSPGHDHRQRRVGRIDAAAADHGDLHRAGRVPDDAQRQGEDGGTGKPGHPAREHRHAALGVDRHAQPGVAGNKGTRSGQLGRARHGGDVGRLRRQLDPERAVPFGAGHLRGLGRQPGVHAPAHAAVIGVRARDVELHAVHHVLHLGDAVHHIGQVFVALHADVQHHGRAALFQPFEAMVDEAVDALVLEADTVEDARRRFPHARAGIAETGILRDGLGADRADVTGQIVLPHAVFVGPGARSDHDGHAQIDAARIDAQRIRDAAHPTSPPWPGKRDRRCRCGAVRWSCRRRSRSSRRSRSPCAFPG